MQDLIWMGCILYNAAFMHFKVGGDYIKKYPFHTALCVMSGLFGTAAIVAVIICAYVIKIGGDNETV